jgi:hypothetical protein
VNNEPVVVNVTAGLILLNSVFVAIQAFGVDLTVDQVTALMGVGNSLGGLIIALLTRRLVTPVPRDHG